MSTYMQVTDTLKKMNVDAAEGGKSPNRISYPSGANTPHQAIYATPK